MTSHTTPLDSTAGRPDFDVIIIGAGLSGLYQQYRVRELGLSVRVIEAGSDVGGTWYWNRYPGARFDSESYSYGFSFSKELLDEWNWSEHFAPQPETLRYTAYVADKFDLRRDIVFGRRVSSAHWQEAARVWQLRLDDGQQLSARFLITAIGALSVPTLPLVDGIESFKGVSCHTAKWPHEPVSFEGKRVAVIGTGATGIQTIQEVAKTAAHLTVFQRTANWCAPLHNRKITDEEQRAIKAGYAEIFQRCSENPGGFIHKPDPRSALEVSREEREAFWEQRYAEPGFGIWVGNYRDILTNRESNALISDFIARKVRERVKDPATAEKLIPKNHGFGTRRLPLETRYYEVYNQPNVELVDLNETPIERITPTGIRTSAGESEFDMIIYATGFDALTGAYGYPRHRRPPPEGRLDGWGKDLLWHPERRVSQPADGDGSAGCTRQYSAQHRVQRRVGFPPARAHESPGSSPGGGARGKRRGLDGYREGKRGRAALERGELLDDRRQSQCEGQVRARTGPLQRYRPRVSGPGGSGGGRGISRA